MDPLIQAAHDTYVEAMGASSDRLTVLRCPGTWELPGMIQEMHERLSPTPDAYVALGCVIKGDTTHDQWINQSVCTVLAHMSVTIRRPIALGVLTCNTMEQAKARAGGSHGNKGREAMQAAIDQALAFNHIDWTGTL